MNYAYTIFHIEGVSAERDSAVDGVKQVMGKVPNLITPTVDFIQPEYRRRFMSENPNFKTIKEFKLGEIGIWASNIKAWEYLLASHYDALLIFEDDIKLDPAFVGGMEQYLAKLPSNWDVFSPYIHWWQQANLFKPEYKVNEDICVAYQNWSLAAYFISKAGAQKALDSIRNGINTAVDLYLFKGIWDFNAYTLMPTSNKYSDLHYFESTIQDRVEKMSVSGGV